MRSFDAETAAGGSGSYTWTGVKEGTYLYHSGTHPQVQVQMGLYGALTVGNYGIGQTKRHVGVQRDRPGPARSGR